MKFYYKFLKNDLPHFFKDMTFSIYNEIPHHSTRISSQFHLPRVKHTFAKNCIRYSPAGTIRWINVEMKFRTTSRRYFNYISTLFQCQMPAGSLPILLNNTPECIKEKLYTHSLNGFTYYIKNHTINKYSSTCIIVNCYICGNH